MLNRFHAVMSHVDLDLWYVIPYDDEMWAQGVAIYIEDGRVTHSISYA